MIRKTLYFSAPGVLDVVEEDCPAPAAGQARLHTLLSAISPGTELLLYRGQFPSELPVDAAISALSGRFQYPLKYGYCLVGRVVELGLGVDPAWQDRLVFAFHPHESDFTAPVNELIAIPDGIPPEAASFLANVETALNFVMDGVPLIGERVVIFGQGVVGLLTTGLLRRFPLESLITLDGFELRRQASLGLGAHASLDPRDTDWRERLLLHLPGEADLVYELSGNPEALDQAIQVTGFAGRIMIGSWYGQKKVSVNLGGSFHRSRIRLVSSQVSSLDPAITGRWDKARRFKLAWQMIRELDPAQFITHRFRMDQAAEAYRLLDQHPDQAIQVLLNYPGEDE